MRKTVISCDGCGDAMTSPGVMIEGEDICVSCANSRIVGLLADRKRIDFLEQTTKGEGTAILNEIYVIVEREKKYKHDRGWRCVHNSDSVGVAPFQTIREAIDAQRTHEEEANADG